VLGEDYALEHFHAYPHGELALVTTPSGVPAFMEFPHYQVKQWDEGFQITFQRAVVRVAVPSPMARQRAATVTIYEGGEEARTILPDVPPRWSMAEQAQAFVSAILEGGEQLSPPREAAKEIAFADEIVRWRQTHGG